MSDAMAAKTERADGCATSALRRAPTQRRGRERVERLLGAAATLIEEQGSEALRMSEVAERAAVSIGSLYQYFPDKSAIVATLAERYNAEGRACIAEALANVTDVAGLKTAFGGLIDTYYRLLLEEPVMRDIWCGTQADRTLQDLALDDSRANGRVLAELMQRLRPDAPRESLAATAFLLIQLTESTVRTAVALERPEGDRLVETLKGMLLREIDTLERAPGS